MFRKYKLKKKIKKLIKTDNFKLDFITIDKEEIITYYNCKLGHRIHFFIMEDKILNCSYHPVDLSKTQYCDCCYCDRLDKLQREGFGVQR